MDALWQSDLAPLIFVALFAVGGVLCFPLVQALRRRLEGGASPDVDRQVMALREELAELREQLDRAADVGARLLEMEERLDFAERLLAREGDRPALRGNE